MYNKNYLSKRPFLIITNRYTPGQNAQTQKKGWANTAGWVVNEEMTIVDRITKKHESYATVIIDVMETKVLRNRFNDMPADEVLGHFMAKYKEQIQRAISIWMERLANQRALSGELDTAEVATVAETTPVETETPAE